MQKNYIPIDYRNWIIGNKAREGVNIKKLNLLNDLELKIFNASAQYHDSREDPGHAEIATFFGIKILETGISGKREIIVPSTILHDSGYEIDPQVFRDAFQSSSPDKQLQRIIRLEHQVGGAMLAYDILNNLNYPPQFTCSIMRNIVDHDTHIADNSSKFAKPSIEGKILMDSDILWRFTLPHAKHYLDKNSCQELFNHMNNELNLPNRFYLLISEKIAKIELANTIYHKFGEQEAKEVLSENYSKEFEKVKEFYLD